MLHLYATVLIRDYVLARTETPGSEASSPRVRRYWPIRHFDSESGMKAWAAGVRETTLK